MKKSFSLLSLAVALVSTGLVYSCASTDDTNDLSGGKGGAGYGTGGSKSLSTGGNGSGLGTNTSSHVGGTGSAASGTNCGATDVAAELTPIFMVFLYDSSASMGVNGTIDNTALRWAPVTAGIKDFFTNADAANVQAAISFFPYPGNAAATCGHDYAVPDVAMTSLDDPAKLIAALDAKEPSGGTPTLPAVYGGIKKAKQLLADNPGSQAMVVLVTDGEPCIYNSTTKACESCVPTGVTGVDNNVTDIATVVSAAYRGTPSIPTHVIGIGTDQAITDLKAIATAGGTEFLQIDPSDASATTNAIVTKLSAIQTKQISCNVPIPTSTAFDSEQVNVNFEHSNGLTIDQLGRSDDCSSTGWHYDDATNPKYIELCPKTCTAIQDDIDGKLTIQLGCPTRIVT